jgi:hypothetical protein
LVVVQFGQRVCGVPLWSVGKFVMLRNVSVKGVEKERMGRVKSWGSFMVGKKTLPFSY